MNTWTTGAKAELEKHLAAIRRPLEQAGADAAEVIDDLKRHIEADIAAAQLRVVTVTDLKPLLARIGHPWLAGTSNTTAFTALEDGIDLDEPPPKKPSVAAPPPAPEPRRKSFPPVGYSLLAFGCIYPALVLLLEWATGFCASHFFNPIPTLGHVLLAASVPAANGFVWWALRHEREARFPRALGRLSAFAFGVAVVYSAVFLPLLLPALVALIFFGLGLLPLAPLIAASATSVLRKRLAQRLGQGKLASAWLGIAVASLAFLLVDFRFVGTTIGLQLAAAQEPNARSVEWLRRFADERTLLRACSPRNPDSSSLAPLLFLFLPKEHHVTAEQARRVYFQVYGRAFNSVPAPRSRSALFPAPELLGRRWDQERGGEKVGSPIPGLSMRTSRIDATAEPNAALAYLEWILEFRNDSPGQAEARCEILLPPGSAVSRLTLWINDEEREAAFAGRGQVRQAYENIVAQRRDPVLVTTSGRDTIFLQCFPVPPKGGLMKMRVGVTVPLQLDSDKNGILRWPIILERNFALAEKLEHTFWLDSPQPVEALGLPLKIERTPSGHFMAHGNLKDSDSIMQPAVLIRRTGLPNRSWAYDSRSDDGSYVVQTIHASPSAPPQNVVLVLDGSISVANHLAALKRLTIGRSFQVVVASENPAEFTVANSNDWSRVLEALEFPGGQDNLPALERAWELAAANGSGAILWVHGPQPLLLSSAETLKQKFERRRNAVALYDLPLERGPNAILPALPPVARWQTVSMHAAPVETLGRLLLELGGRLERFEATRERVQPGEPPSGAESNLHLVRAWASDEIHRLVSAGQRAQAVALAGRYHLVSEVSGAVVLETAEQFERAGLKPVDPSTVPVVPEPSTWAFLALGALLLLARGKLRKP
jgi:hypothetical protein